MNRIEREEFEYTTNNYLYNKLKKVYHEHQGHIRCAYCAYHYFENLPKRWQKRNWKWHRKTQFKV